jgi:class 3 adenylate cyclase
VVISDLDETGEPAVIGEPVTLAVTLQAAAAPGTVVIASDTRNRVCDRFDHVAFEPVVVGGTAVTPAWRVIGTSMRNRLLA